MHDLTGAEPLLVTLTRRTIVYRRQAYHADRLRTHIKARGVIANIPNMIRRKKRFRWTKALYRKRNNVERFFNKLKFRRIHPLDKLRESHERCTQTAYPA